MKPNNRNLKRPKGIPVYVAFLHGNESCAICGNSATCALNMGRGAVIACSRCFRRYAPRLFSNLRDQLKTGAERLSEGDAL